MSLSCLVVERLESLRPKLSKAVFALALACLSVAALHAQEKLLYSFGKSGSVGTLPFGGLVMDSKGNLYGTTDADRTDGSGSGTVFKLTPAANGTWTESILHTFSGTAGTGDPDGANPSANLVFDAQGNLYGTTAGGGPQDSGIVFELIPTASGPWTEKILYTFPGANDGYSPSAAVVFDTKGNLYSITNYGGTHGNGNVFELTPTSSGPWTETVLYNFGSIAKDGANPVSALVFDAAGNLYGTTEFGGSANNGTAFELLPPASGTGPWTEKILYNFGTTATAASQPGAGLVFDTKGNLYGTTMQGGVNTSGGAAVYGTVYELIRATNGTYTESVIHSFGPDNGDGYDSFATLIIDSSGNLYGTTANGGNPVGGTVFELSPSGTSWTEKILSNLAALTNGPTTPVTGVILDSSGNLYGTTEFGGAYEDDNNDAGTVYEIVGAAGKSTAAPTFSPAGGTYSATQSVTLADATSGATIYYTTDGTTPTTASAHYTGAISVSESETIKAIAAASGLPASGVASATYTISASTATATPAFSPAGGSYTATQSVKLTDATSGAVIYYTTNGSTPTTGSTKYSAALTVASSETIKAIAVASGHTQSAVASATYTIGKQAVAPVFSPAAGSYAAGQKVTLTDSTTGATIYYTTNGAGPTTASTKYTAAITVNATETIKAIAVASGYTNSIVASATYTISASTATAAPTFSPGAGTYTSAVTVKLADATSGPVIYYTTNGTTPTTASTQYTAAIVISKTTSLKAIAVASGHTSAVTSGTYTIQVASPTFAPASGTYTSAQSVTLSDSTSGATIYYTTNGSTPTNSSTRYTGAIKVSSTETIKAIAYGSGRLPSTVASATYTIK